MVWIIKRLEQSKSVFWLDSSISRLLRALLDIHRIKQRFVIILFFFILLSAHISFPFWLIIVTDRSDFTLHQPKKVFFFKKRLRLDKKKWTQFARVCTGSVVFYVWWLSFGTITIVLNWTHWYFSVKSTGGKATAHSAERDLYWENLTFTATAVHVWE